MIDTLKFAKELQEVGMTAEQSEAYVRNLLNVMGTNFATKHDLESFKNNEFRALETKVTDLKSEMNYRFESLEQRITIKMGVMISFAVGLIVTLQKLL